MSSVLIETLARRPSAKPAVGSRVATALLKDEQIIVGSRAVVATEAGVPPSHVIVSVVAASLLLVFDIAAPSQAEADSIVASLSGSMSTPEAAACASCC